MDLSIIIPVHNPGREKFVKCLESIMNQTYSEWEAILVDDNSTDNSLEICWEYEKKDARFHTIHCEQSGGPSKARNIGIDMAKGKYISFIDSDDFIDPNMYADMIRVLETKKADLVLVDCWLYYSDKNKTKMNQKKYQKNEFTSLDKYELTKSIFDVPKTIFPSAWGKVFLKNVIGNIRFNETIHFSEDWLFCIEYFMKIQKAIYVNKGYYYYLLRDDEDEEYKLSLNFSGTLTAREIMYEMIYSQMESLTDYVMYEDVDKCLYKFINLYKYYCKDEKKVKKVQKKINSHQRKMFRKYPKVFWGNQYFSFKRKIYLWMHAHMPLVVLNKYYKYKKNLV